MHTFAFNQPCSYLSLRDRAPTRIIVHLQLWHAHSHYRAASARLCAKLWTGLLSADHAIRVVLCVDHLFYEGLHMLFATSGIAIELALCHKGKGDR